MNWFGIKFSSMALFFALLTGCSTAVQIPTSLSSNATCMAAGIPDVFAFANRIAVNSPYSVASTLPTFIPVFASQSLADDVKPNAAITTIVIAIHGLSRDANAYFCSALQASSAQIAAGNTLVVAPWFGDVQVGVDLWSSPANPATNDSSVSVFWGTSRWLNGGDTSPGANDQPPARYTSAFDVFEAMLSQLNVATRFPSLQLVTVVGFSAGAQFVSRFAVFSQAGLPTAGGAFAHVRFIVSDPSSYLYLTAERPADSCRPLSDTGASWDCSSFAVPSPDVVTGCPSYNAYKYGLEQLDTENAYLHPFQLNASLTSQAVAAFARKDVWYLLGGDDVCNCNTPGYVNPPDTASTTSVCFPAIVVNGTVSPPQCHDTYPDAPENALDVTCSSMLQGSNRLQRGLLYAAHLRAHFVNVMQLQVKVIPGMGHDKVALYNSPAFQAVAYTLLL